MAHKVAFIHTVSSLVQPFNELAKEILPAGTEIFHIADEILLKEVLDRGGPSPFIYRRVSDHVTAAEEFGADVVMLTCSSVAPALEAARRMVGIPVLRVDEAMVEQAVSLARRIGVVATAPTTHEPTTAAVRAEARRLGKEVEIEPALCREAYQALFAGDLARHDALLRETIAGLMTRNDVVILAQASMARVVESIPVGQRTVPILSSPRLAVERMSQVLQAAGDKPEGA